MFRSFTGVDKIVNLFVECDLWARINVSAFNAASAKLISVMDKIT